MTDPRRMVAKVGSQVLCDSEGALDTIMIRELADQVAALGNDGWDVLVVSSGAVAAGQEQLGKATSRISNPVTRQQVLAAAGQVALMDAWQQAFSRHHRATAQVLVSKSDFQSRHHYLNARACIEGALLTNLIPIINENDVVSTTELMFTDNDELAGLLAAMVGAEHLCLLSSVDGVLDPQAVPIAQWSDDEHVIEDVVQTGTSRLGRGGMHSKLAVARKTSGLGTRVTIANGRHANVLLRIAAGESLGTRFPARTDRVTSAKRWLASMDDHAMGAVIINAGARDALLDAGRMSSLLPIGIEEILGDFETGDVIQVQDKTGQVLGCGRAQYDATQARKNLGLRDQKPLIHCDYLYLEH